MEKGLRISAEKQMETIEKIYPPAGEYPVTVPYSKVIVNTFTEDNVFVSLSYEVHRVYQSRKGLIVVVVPQAVVEPRKYRLERKETDENAGPESN